MEFYKKVLVLKEISEGFSITGKAVSGIARMEKDSGVSTFYLSLINVATTDGGNYFAFLKCGKKLLCFDLGKRPLSYRTVITEELDLSLGFAVSLCFIRDDLPITVAFACTDTCTFGVSEMKKSVIDKCLADRKISKKDKPLPKPPTPVKPPLSPLPTPDPNTCPPDEFKDYNDEVVATENYYDNDLDFAEKLKFIERFDDDFLQFKNAVSSDQNQTKTQENSAFADGFPHEENPCNSKNFSAENPYYLTVQNELEDLLAKFPEEPCLKRNVPDSRWVKIHYSETKYYVVGIVKENCLEKYICYGVPGKYSPEPPPTLKGFCSFVPCSIFDLTGDGYWMMFQDAITGECIKMN